MLLSKPKSKTAARTGFATRSLWNHSKLGHTSVRVTEKHYNPWNLARQVQAEADVKRSWERDPLVFLETTGNDEGYV
jgi:hypothetical protein